MDTRLHITFENIQQDDAIEARIRAEAARLEDVIERMGAIRVVVTRLQNRHAQGDLWGVRIDATVPGGILIAANREPAATGEHEDVQVAIRDAFRAMRRQLKEKAERRQGNVKYHEAPPHGRIASLRPDRDHGFIASADGREIYFHRNSVAGDRFERLEVGQEVRFAEAIGDKGPQATIVKPIGKRHVVETKRRP